MSVSVPNYLLCGYVTMSCFPLATTCLCWRGHLPGSGDGVRATEESSHKFLQVPKEVQDYVSQCLHL